MLWFDMYAPLVGAGGSVLAIGLALGALLRRPRAAQHTPMQAPPEPAHTLNLNGALDTVLVKAMESQTSMFREMQALNLENARLAMDNILSRKRSKAGAVRAATAKRKGGKFLPDCRLCRDPMVGNPTVAEIIAHSPHRVATADPPARPEPAPAPAIRYVDRGSHIDAQVPEAHIQVGADGIEQIECPDCGPGHYHRPGMPHTFEQNVH